MMGWVPACADMTGPNVGARHTVPVLLVFSSGDVIAAGRGR